MSKSSGYARTAQLERHLRAHGAELLREGARHSVWAIGGPESEVLRAETISAHLSLDEGYSYLVGSAPSPGESLNRLAAYENSRRCSTCC
ncbi:MAG: hypothetical protein ACR2OB_02210 [Solirubrobacteraceae bacterium]